VRNIVMWCRSTINQRSHNTLLFFLAMLLPRTFSFTTRRSINKGSFYSRIICPRHIMLSSESAAAAAADPSTKDENAQRKAAAKAKRKLLMGLPKAVDHGNGKYLVTYRPGGIDSKSFQALSGLPDRTKPFLVLGIESSCDDTGAAIVCSDGTILGEALASQSEIHEAWGGVVPGLARDAHVAKMDIVIAQALERANLSSVEEVDAIGVTVGPGLEICLRVGCETAKELAIKYRKPFVGVHHLEAHILMARLPFDSTEDNTDPTLTKHHISATKNTHESFRAMEFPFLSLLVSGGHCQLLRCESIGKYSIMGGTLDDSLGEAFDKVARLLGLPIGGGGGPALEALAREGDSTAIPLSVPLQARKDCDFSYSGLKTNVMRAVNKLVEERKVESVNDLSRKDKADIAASFQNVAFKHIEQRLKLAMSILEPEGTRKLAVVGGVAANAELRSRLSKLCQERDEPWSMYVPPPRLCTDQGAMSAWAAVERLMVGSSDDPATQGVYARYPFSMPPPTIPS
jgi:N6-L-threonylcarbamoyladenine synthase